MNDADEDQRTVWCGNLSNKVTEEILYELFLQAAPLQRVCVPKDKEGNNLSYGFVTFKHLVSVQYATDLLNGIALFDKEIRIKPRSNNFQRQNLRNDNVFMLTQPVPVQPVNSLQTLNALNGLNFLMQMGNNLLIDHKTQDDFNYNHHIKTSTPYRHRDRPHYREDRHEDNRSYRRVHGGGHHNNDRRNRAPYYDRRQNYRT